MATSDRYATILMANDLLHRPRGAGSGAAPQLGWL